MYVRIPVCETVFCIMAFANAGDKKTGTVLTIMDLFFPSNEPYFKWPWGGERRLQGKGHGTMLSVRTSRMFNIEMFGSRQKER